MRSNNSIIEGITKSNIKKVQIDEKLAAPAPPIPPPIKTIRIKVIQ